MKIFGESTWEYRGSSLANDAPAPSSVKLHPKHANLRHSTRCSRYLCIHNGQAALDHHADLGDPQANFAAAYAQELGPSIAAETGLLERTTS